MIVREPRWHGEFLPPGAAGLYRSPVAMLGGRVVAVRRGMGDVLNPTAGSQLDCGLFNFGVFRKECWCLQFPSLCSSSDYQAAVALANPDVVYGGGPPAPAHTPPVSAGLSTVPAPYTADQAQAAIDAALAAGAAQTQQQNLDYFSGVQTTLDNVAASQPAGVPMWAWVLAGGAVVLMAASAVRRR